MRDSATRPSTVVRRAADAHDVKRIKDEFVMNRFEGKTALVTRRNSGIGLTTARAFANGPCVVITGCDQSTLVRRRAGSLPTPSDPQRCWQIADRDALQRC